MTLLILGGTREAHDLAAQITRPAVVSLAHGLEQRAYPLPVQRGGFGGGAAQRAWMVEAGISAVIDASHAFASVISPRTIALCADLGLPYLRLLRPAWEAPLALEVATPAEAVALVPDNATVLLTVGSEHLDAFAGLDGYVFCRTIVAGRPFPFRRGEWLIGAPGFVAEEHDMMKRLGISHLVSRNSGGPRSKLDAAEELGVDIILIARPALPQGVHPAASVAEALAWLEGVP